MHLLKRYTTNLLKDIRYAENLLEPTSRLFCVCMYVCVHVTLRPPLLAELLGSPDLYVMQIEMDVYTLAKKVRFLESEKLYS